MVERTRPAKGRRKSPFGWIGRTSRCFRRPLAGPPPFYLHDFLNSLQARSTVKILSIQQIGSSLGHQGDPMVWLPPFYPLNQFPNRMSIVAHAARRRCPTQDNIRSLAFTAWPSNPTLLAFASNQVASSTSARKCLSQDNPITLLRAGLYLSSYLCQADNWIFVKKSSLDGTTVTSWARSKL